MPKVNFKITSDKNTGLVISPAELLELYFFGTPPPTIEGKNITNDTLEHYIRLATEYVEDKLDIKVMPTIQTEERDFVSNDWVEWGYLETRFPVKQALSLRGVYNDVYQIDYPREWLSAKKDTDGLYYPRMFLVPVSGGADVTGGSLILTDYITFWGTLGYGKVPNYWEVTYCTGFDRVPELILGVIAKVAAIPVFMILGDLILGAGIASQSLSIDGLSQAISSTSSATSSGYGSRILELTKQIKNELPVLKSKYTGVRFDTC